MKFTLRKIGIFAGNIRSCANNMLLKMTPSNMDQPNVSLIKAFYMNHQNFSNHKRFHPFFHYLVLPLSLVGLVLAAIALLNTSTENLITSILLTIAFFLLFCIAGIARMYSLKVQDRVIRNEENFRHFVLTGKPLDPQLRIGQIVALRFASDAEFPELAKRASTEKLRSSEIKKAIQQWRPDTYRV